MSDFDNATQEVSLLTQEGVELKHSDFGNERVLEEVACGVDSLGNKRVLKADAAGNLQVIMPVSSVVNNIPVQLGIYLRRQE